VCEFTVDRKVLSGYVQRIGRDVNGNDPGVGKVFRESDGNVAAARANVQDKQRIKNAASMCTTEKSESIFDEMFRFRPGDKDRRIDAERDGEELPGSCEVGYRYAVMAFLDYFSECVPCIGLDRFFVVQVKTQTVPLQHMGKQDFGVQSRGLQTGTGEVAGRPREKLFHRPKGRQGFWERSYVPVRIKFL
jgi:hypothetical protein